MRPTQPSGTPPEGCCGHVGTSQGPGRARAWVRSGLAACPFFRAEAAWPRRTCPNAEQGLMGSHEESRGVTGSHEESRGAQGFGEKTREKCRVLVSAQCYGYLLAVIFIVSQRNLVNQSSREKRIPLKTSRPCPPPASSPSSPSTPSPAEGLLRAALDALRTSV